MKYSEDRIKTLALNIHNRLYLDNEVDYTDEEKSLQVIKKIMLEFFQWEDKVDEFVKNKILSHKRQILPDSPDWNILYNKYFEEEMRKKKM